ncbi:MAG: hypothetical protein K2I03_04035 [Lachnospiraceae bacterium]|nr:hypothetical protein [Lachnospiraceae bacterium]
MEKKKLIISAVIVPVIAVSLLITIHLYNEKHSAPWSVEKLKGEQQDINTDGYNIKLCSYLYDDYAKVGFCVFKVPHSTTENGLNSTDGFGPDDRFELYRIPSTYDNSKVVKDGKNMDIYYQFIADTDKSDDKIYLYDDKSEKLHDVSSEKSASGEFLLKNNVESKRYKIGEYHELYISQLCVGVVSNTGNSTAVMPGKLEICYKEGRTQKLITDSEINSKFIVTKENNDKHSFERCIFRDIVNIDEIEYVIVNGKKYETT